MGYYEDIPNFIFKQTGDAKEEKNMVLLIKSIVMNGDSEK